jgi:hypothetical protein
MSFHFWANHNFSEVLCFLQCSRTSKSGTILSGRGYKRFLCVLTRGTCRMCKIERDYPEIGSFTRALSPHAYRNLTVHALTPQPHTITHTPNPKKYWGSVLTLNPPPLPNRTRIPMHQIHTSLDINIESSHVQPLAGTAALQ